MKSQHKPTKRKGILRSRLSRTYIIILLLCSNFIISQSIVEQHGRLRVNGNKVVNQNNESISLAGNSLFWSNFSEGAKFYNAATVNHLATDWKSDIVRASMGVEDFGGYISNPTQEKNKVIAVVDAAIAAGIYVIIDWHSHNAEQYEQQAIEFFSEMADLYGTNDHVIYEVYNEPIGQSWQTVKSYSEAVIDAIRAKDPDNLIIVGSPTWSQDVVDASNSPINKTNIAYTLHFYAGTHKQVLRDQATQAMQNGIALFVTEWGAVNANGDGAADQSETQKWLDFMRDNGISHANWSVSDKAEGASVVASGTGVSGLTNNNLTSTGNYIKDIIENWNTNGGNPTPPTNPCTGNGVSINNIIQAEDFCDQNGTQIETTTDNGGGENVGYIDNGDYLRYRVNIPANDQYTITYRVASIVNTGSIQFKDGTTVLETTSIPLTNGWQSWTTITTEVDLTAGSKTIELYAQSGSFNINWLEISPSDSNPDPDPDPNPPGNDCAFGTPLATALPTIVNASYSNIHVIGNQGPDLSNVSNFTINWSLPNNGLWQLSMNTNNGNPNWWNDLLGNASWSFNEAQPSITFSDSGFPGLDDSYWVALDGNNFVMASKTKEFSIYFSNSNTPPNCSNSRNTKDNAAISVHLSPVPVENELRISGITGNTTIQIYNILGSLVKTVSLKSDNKSIDISDLSKGKYFAKISGEKSNTSIQFIKK